MDGDKADCMDNTDSRMVALYETREELAELFSDRFMRKYTSFKDFEEFTFSCAVFVNWRADFVVGDRTAFDNCVQGKTIFTTWAEMYNKAIEFRERPSEENN